MTLTLHLVAERERLPLGLVRGGPRYPYLLLPGPAMVRGRYRLRSGPHHESQERVGVHCPWREACFPWSPVCGGSEQFLKMLVNVCLSTLRHSCLYLHVGKSPDVTLCG